jgi:hypothetical protein
MNDALAVHRLHFAFTITFHYLFPLQPQVLRNLSERPLGFFFLSSP